MAAKRTWCVRTPTVGAFLLATLALAASVGSADSGSGSRSSADVDGSWRPNFRIGPVKFNYQLPDDVTVLKQGKQGAFAVRAQSGAVIRGFLFPDPNNGREAARAIWTESRLVSFKGVRVGVNWRDARQKLGSGFERRHGSGCGWLNSSALRGDRTGPVSTQVYFNRRTGRVFRIALNEITEIDCP